MAKMNSSVGTSEARECTGRRYTKEPLPGSARQGEGSGAGFLKDEAAERGQHGLAARLAAAPVHGPAEARAWLGESAVDLEIGDVVDSGHSDVPGETEVSCFAEVEGCSRRADQAVDSGLVKALGVLHWE
jgi:hypothetical protein